MGSVVGAVCGSPQDEEKAAEMEMSLMQSLQQALALESKFQPKLQLPLTATGTVSNKQVTVILIISADKRLPFAPSGMRRNNLCDERRCCSRFALPQSVVRSALFSSARCS